MLWWVHPNPLIWNTPPNWKSFVRSTTRCPMDLTWRCTSRWVTRIRHPHPCAPYTLTHPNRVREHAYRLRRGWMRAARGALGVTCRASNRHVSPPLANSLDGPVDNSIPWLRAAAPFTHPHTHTVWWMLCKRIRLVIKFVLILSFVFVDFWSLKIQRACGVGRVEIFVLREIINLFN